MTLGLIVHVLFFILLTVDDWHVRGCFSNSVGQINICH